MSQHRVKAALVMLMGDPSSDPRPNRMIAFLGQKGYAVDVLSHFAKSNMLCDQHFVIEKSGNLFSKVFRRALRLLNNVDIITPDDRIKDGINDFAFDLYRFRKLLSSRTYDTIIVEDLFLLPIAFSIKGDAKVIFDAREYYPRQNEDNVLWRLIEQKERVRLCRKYLEKCDAVLTVSNGLASEYTREFGVEAQVYLSTPLYVERAVCPTSVHRIKMVHHGAANPNRRLERMIDTMRLLDNRFELDFYLTGSKSYIKHLQSYSESVPAVRFLAPVAFDQINAMLCSYDIGFYYLEPNGFNVTRNLPNKFFEFMQARLAVAIGPSPDMADFVSRYQFGIIAEDFSVESMAAKLSTLTPADIDRMKHRADVAARELNFEVESTKLANLLNAI